MQLVHFSSTHQLFPLYHKNSGCCLTSTEVPYTLLQRITPSTGRNCHFTEMASWFTLLPTFLRRTKILVATLGHGDVDTKNNKHVLPTCLCLMSQGLLTTRKERARERASSRAAGGRGLRLSYLKQSPSWQKWGTFNLADLETITLGSC